MGLISISVLVASVVYVFVRPPPWMPLWFLQWRHGQLPSLGARQIPSSARTKNDDDVTTNEKPGDDSVVPVEPPRIAVNGETKTQPRNHDASLMPPPPLPVVNSAPTLVEPAGDTTPKAEPSTPSISVPSFSLDSPATSSSSSMMPPPSFSMPPPPRPMNAAQTPVSKAPNGRIPTLGQFPAVNSIQRARGPAPSRGPPQASSGLTPPPTITTKPQKPSRKVLLEPGHSPLDWASISGPNADLRGVPPETPYLKVTPSMLKEKTGRKGKDAWMAINGKVYNVSPYAKYHPGGVPELMRAAGRDGTKLFYEIHPWVNYDTMLAACLVGLMVEEPEGSGPSKMDEMD